MRDSEAVKKVRETARHTEDGKKKLKEIKPHSSEESEDKVVEGEIDNDDNDEYVYYFLTERAPARSRGWNEGWGWVVGR